MAGQDQTISGQLQDSQVQLAQAGENAVSFQNSHDNQITILKTFQLFGSGATPTAAAMDWDYAQEILKDQRHEIQARLRYTLDDLHHLMSVDFKWVKWASPLQAERRLQVEDTDQGSLDSQTLLIQTFGEVGGKLLILGTPGAGKTTALLELAEQLVCGAIAQPQTVIPVIFELSTWSKDNQSIEDWLVERLQYQYGGKRQIYQTWIERKKLLPLLDGLDELGLERQKACTQKLNEFARTYPRMVVCCRVKKFEQVGIKLTNLRGSVCLEPLADGQLQDYWKTVKRPGLWAEIQGNKGLRPLLEPTAEGDPGLLRIPLFVTLAAKVYDPNYPFQGKRDLLRQYVEHQLSWDVRDAERRRELEGRSWEYATFEDEPDRQETKRTLSWIAQQLNYDNQVELLIENMQPEWLENNQSKRFYRLLVFLLVFLLFGLLLGLFLWSNFGPPPLFTLFVWLNFLLIVGLGVGEFQIKSVELFEILMLCEERRELFKYFLRPLLLSGLLVGLPVGLLVELTDGLTDGLLVGLTDGLILGLSIGLSIGPMMGLALGLVPQLKLRSHPNQGIKNSLQSIIWLTTLIYFFGVVFSGLGSASRHIADGMSNGESIASLLATFWANLPQFFIPHIFSGALLYGFLVGGGMPVVQHYCLRFVLTWHKIAPWDLPRFLNYCVERRLLQRVGGRYRFLHRELLDYFANLAG